MINSSILTNTLINKENNSYRTKANQKSVSFTGINNLKIIYKPIRLDYIIPEKPSKWEFFHKKVSNIIKKPQEIKETLLWAGITTITGGITTALIKGCNLSNNNNAISATLLNCGLILSVTGGIILSGLSAFATLFKGFEALDNTD